MKRFVNVVLVLCVLGLVMVVETSAQQRAGGNFRGQTAEILCDFLVLSPDKAEKVVAAYDEVRQQIREEMGSNRPDFQSMSEDQRREYFEKSQKDTAAKMKEACKDLLSEKELEALEPLMARRAFMPDAEMRGLRQIDLKEEQLAKLQPLAIELGKKVVSGMRFFGAQTDTAEREKAQKAYDEAKAEFVGKAKEILSAEQNTAWEEKSKAAQKEIDEMQERMRSMRRQN
ncbi:MAG: hypothetical protein RBU29_06320 [bacterium]|jgi:hypothetical protein|nr:hypothetical protein [bacterium]